MRVDHISIKVNSGYNLVTVDEWLQLSVAERVSYIRGEKVQFLCGEDTVPLREALEWIKANKSDE